MHKILAKKLKNNALKLDLKTYDSRKNALIFATISFFCTIHKTFFAKFLQKIILWIWHFLALNFLTSQQRQPMQTHSLRYLLCAKSRLFYFSLSTQNHQGWQTLIRAICAPIFISTLNAQSMPKSTLESNLQIAESSKKSTQNIIDSTKDSIIPPPHNLAHSAESKLDSTASLASLESLDSTPQKTLAQFFATNPAFGEKQNAIRLEFGASVRSKGFENLYQVKFIYSQPNRFFRIHGRLNLELGGFFGFGNGFDKVSLNALNLAFAGISEDILLPFFVSKNYGNLYAGLGIGAYIKSNGELRVGSNFTFGERVFVGYLWQHFSFEIFVKHFSNGTLSLPNSGHNFFGITSGYVF